MGFSAPQSNRAPRFLLCKLGFWFFWIRGVLAGTPDEKESYFPHHSGVNLENPKRSKPKEELCMLIFFFVNPHTAATTFPFSPLSRPCVWIRIINIEGLSPSRRVLKGLQWNLKMCRVKPPTGYRSAGRKRTGSVNTVAWSWTGSNYSFCQKCSLKSGVHCLNCPIECLWWVCCRLWSVTAFHHTCLAFSTRTQALGEVVYFDIHPAWSDSICLYFENCLGNCSD